MSIRLARWLVLVALLTPAPRTVEAQLATKTYSELVALNVEQPSLFELS